MSFTKEQIDDICKGYRNAKDKNEQLGILSQLNACTISDIVDVLVKRGYIDKPNTSKEIIEQPSNEDISTRKKRKRIKWDDNEVSKLRELLKSGMSISSIADAYGLEYSSMYNIINRKIPDKNDIMNKSKDIKESSEDHIQEDSKEIHDPEEESATCPENENNFTYSDIKLSTPLYRNNYLIEFTGDYISKERLDLLTYSVNKASLHDGILSLDFIHRNESKLLSTIDDIFSRHIALGIKFKLANQYGEIDDYISHSSSLISYSAEFDSNKDIVHIFAWFEWKDI